MNPVGTVLVQAARIKNYRPGGLNSRHLFLTVLEAGKPKVKVLASSILGLQTAAFLLCAHVVERELELWFLSLLF